MKKICVTFILLTLFKVNLLAVPASPFLITFAQPDGSTFKAHLRGDEYFSWIETTNKKIIVKNKTSGFFEFALLELDDNNNFVLVPSGMPVIKRGQSTLSPAPDIPKISRVQLGKIWQRKISAKKNIKLVPTKKNRLKE